MTDPPGSDRVQENVPTASGSGDNSATVAREGGSSFDDVPLTREEAVARDAARPDDLPAKADTDASLAQRSGPVDGA